MSWASRTVIRLRDSSIPRAASTGRRIPAVVLGAPDASARYHLDRCVDDDAGRRIAVVEGGRVDKWLERRAGLALGLRRPVELALVEAEAADQGSTRPVCGSIDHHRAADLRHLLQAHSRLQTRRPVDIDNIPGIEHLCRRTDFLSAPLAARPSRPTQLFQRYAPTSRRSLKRSRGQPLRLKPDRAPPSSTSSTTASTQGSISRSADATDGSPQSPRYRLFHRTAPAAAAIIADETIDQACDGDDLQLRIERGAHRQAAFVETFVAVRSSSLAAHLLGEIVGCDELRETGTRRDNDFGARAARLPRLVM
jgi:hypothetical protein